MFLNCWYCDHAVGQSRSLRAKSRQARAGKVAQPVSVLYFSIMTRSARDSLPRYIAIEGPIGVGKTSLARKLSKRFGARLILESFDDNPFLESFHRNRGQVAFQTQVYFLMARLKQQEQLYQQELFAQATVADYLPLKDRIFANLNLSSAELQLYDKIYSLVRPRFLAPDLVVYLRASVSTLMHRLMRRGRSIERHVDDDYLGEVAGAYQRYFRHYRETALMEMDTTDLDFVHRERDFETIVETIQSNQEHRRGGRAPRHGGAAI